MDMGAQGGMMVGRGSGAMIGSFFGAVWLGLGMYAAGVFSWWMAMAFVVGCVVLFAGSLRLVRRGQKLLSAAGTKREWPKGMRNGFRWTLIAEIAGCVAVVVVCNLLRRYELIPVGIAFVVGLHFLPLAKVFRAPIYYATGTLVPVWCVASLLLFRGLMIGVAAAIGTGIFLWLTAAYHLVQTRAFFPAATAENSPSI
jgi:hypothetical protein